MQKVSDVKLKDLQLNQRPNLRLRIGVHPDAVHKGGVNLFGKQFGDHAQDIVMRVTYTQEEAE
ncbi:hypothetical protein D1872_316760 [compost metagenome]